MGISVNILIWENYFHCVGNNLFELPMCVYNLCNQCIFNSSKSFLGLEFEEKINTQFIKNTSYRHTYVEINIREIRTHIYEWKKWLPLNYVFFIPMNIDNRAISLLEMQLIFDSYEWNILLKRKQNYKCVCVCESVCVKMHPNIFKRKKLWKAYVWFQV